MCKLAKEINEAQQTRYDEAIAKKNAIIEHQIMLRNRWKMGGQKSSPSNF